MEIKVSRWRNGDIYASRFIFSKEVWRFLQISNIIKELANAGMNLHTISGNEEIVLRKETVEIHSPNPLTFTMGETAIIIAAEDAVSAMLDARVELNHSVLDASPSGNIPLGEFSIPLPDSIAA